MKKGKLLGLGLLLLLIVGALMYLRLATPPPKLSTSMPLGAEKPKPVDREFRGCPPEGDGGDRALNLLKNRIDTGNYYPVAFDSVEKLPWPAPVQRMRRAEWSGQDTSEVAQYEGLPIACEGFLAGAREEGPESPNCHGEEFTERDFHVWLVRTEDDGRENSIVVELTPPVRALHPNWDLTTLKHIVTDKPRVRISGWLMLDQEHPEQVGKTRGTLWEIHPVMQIEIKNGISWTPLDNYND